MMDKDWELKPFKQEHADQIISYGMNHKLMEIDASFKDNRICLADRGDAYTLFLNKKPIVAGGICLLWQGVAEGWVLANQNIYDIIQMCNYKYPRGRIFQPGLTGGSCLRKDFGMLNETVYRDISFK